MKDNCKRRICKTTGMMILVRTHVEVMKYDSSITLKYLSDATKSRGIVLIITSSPRKKLLSSREFLDNVGRQRAMFSFNRRNLLLYFVSENRLNDQAGL